MAAVAVVTTIITTNMIKAVLIEDDLAACARKPALANRRRAFFVTSICWRQTIEGLWMCHGIRYTADV